LALDCSDGIESVDDTGDITTCVTTDEVSDGSGGTNTTVTTTIEDCSGRTCLTSSGSSWSFASAP